MGAEKAVTISERDRKRTSTFKSVRSFIRIGKYRQCDSSGEEENLLMSRPGPSSEPDLPVSRTSVSSDEILVDTRSPTETPKIRKL